MTVLKEVNDTSVHVNEAPDDAAWREKTIFWNSVLILIIVDLVVGSPSMAGILVARVQIDAPHLVLAVKVLGAGSVYEALTAETDVDAWPSLTFWQTVDSQLKIVLVLLVLQRNLVYISHT